MKNKRTASLLLVMVLILSTFSSVFAAELDLKNTQTNKEYSLLDWFEDPMVLLDLNDNPQNYVIEVGEKTYNLSEITEKMQADKDLTLEEAVKDLTPVDEKPVEDELKVVEISAINATEIRVKFSNGDVENFTVKELTEGENTVEFEYKGQKFTEKVNFAAPVEPVEKAEVESVELVNYRQMKVTFNRVVNETSATDPANYYFELVDGLAGKLGVAGDVTKNNTLADIDTTNTGWWGTAAARTNITASREADKTVVTINLPEDARFDNGLTIKDMVTSGTTEKVLREGVSFKFAVRDVKDASGKKSIDTAVEEIIVKDNVKPELKAVSILHADTTVTKDVDLSKTVDVKVDDKIVLEFSEPLEAHNTVGKEVKVYRDGKELNTTTNTVGANAIAIEKVATTTYDDAKLATIDLGSTNGFLEGLTPTKGDTFVVALTGIRDLAGNIIQEAISFNIKVVEDETTPPTTPDTVKILGVEQVLDNVLRIEGNKAAAEATLGAVNVVIKEAAMDKTDVVVEFDGTTNKLTFAQNPDDGKYYAYVAFPAKYKATTAAEGVDFKGGFYLNKTVVVESKATTPEFETCTEENMHIEIDRQAPTLNTDQIDIEYADASSTDLKLRIGFTDVNPENWVTDSTVKAIQEKIFTNNAKDYITSVVDGIRVKVEYVNDNEDKVNRYVDIDYVAAAAAGKAHIDGTTNELVIDLKGTNLLVDKTNTELTNLQQLKSGATFEVSLPKGVASDDYLGKDTGLTVQTGTTAATAIFLDESGRANTTGTDEHGYTSVAANVTIIIGEDKTAPTGKENKVPQTSKKLIAYDRNTDELVILVTGLPTKDSVEDLDNYVLNGKTLTEREVTKADVLFADAKDEDVLLVSGLATISAATSAGYQTADKYKVIRIKLPEGSIKKDGPADLTVRGLRHIEEGMMAEVSVVVEGLKDNTAPEYVSGKIEGSNKLLLKFDEPVVLVEDALPTSAIRNFKVKINGELVSILSVNANGSNILEIEIANDNTIINKAEIEIVMNNNGKMEIADEAGNELKVTETPIVIVK
ncbi:hypothetical protein [Anaerosalibacter sp. Marseille-P3206]|uniref:hypothetical protein n=1 Tax=Anaerosalibacter sp. Marseille-P3206 TaxID=1871005 RepID=UPI0009862C72|nr:hypothetical protein [Anaerosalibacter sp. Marseille-P3206]